MSVDGVPRHEHYMRRCIELARRATTSGDARVGALVVSGDRIVAEGIEGVKARGDVTAHAEIEALRAACQRLGTLDLGACTLYTSVEPCVMCAYAIRLARVGTLVSGARAAESERRVGGWTVLTDLDALPSRPCPVVVRDVLARECRAALQERRTRGGT